MEQVAFRLPREVIDRIDKHAQRMAVQSPGLVLTRSDVVRVLIVRALEDVEQPGARKK